jgi:hypothetical protein
MQPDAHLPLSPSTHIDQQLELVLYIHPILNFLVLFTLKPKSQKHQNTTNYSDWDSSTMQTWSSFFSLFFYNLVGVVGALCGLTGTFSIKTWLPLQFVRWIIWHLCKLLSEKSWLILECRHSYQAINSWSFYGEVCIVVASKFCNYLGQVVELPTIKKKTLKRWWEFPYSKT